MRQPKIYDGGYGFRTDIGIDPVTGKRKQKRFGPFRTKGEAKKKRAGTMVEVTNGTFVNPTDMKLGEFLIKWLEHKRKNVSKGTMANYQLYVIKHLSIFIFIVTCLFQLFSLIH
ncbi:Arm DNA-binding domain-containing protein [Fictibacillus sp. NRS-1165]|uniref:Arm DNA-binding domain-containing protein n=1 Tax=Fictibacillus sp. NRS-1165 TaxID=3144463 RepID=UPI003D230F73